MAITQAMCTSFKTQLLTATHNFATNGNAFKLALYTSSATMGATTTAYSTSQEVSNSGSYSAGGGTLTKVAPTSSGTTGFTDFADLSFTTATITAPAAAPSLLRENTPSILAGGPAIPGAAAGTGLNLGKYTDTHRELINLRLVSKKKTKLSKNPLLLVLRDRRLPPLKLWRS